MGSSQSQHVSVEDAAAASPPPKPASGMMQAEPDFDVQDLLRHLQEREGYEIYDIFEGRGRTRVSAPLRQWLEDKEDWLAAGAVSAADIPVPSSSSSSPASASKEKALLVDVTDSKSTSEAAKSAQSGTADEEAGCVCVEKDHWVLLSAPVRPVPVPKGKSGRPPGAKGKAPPPPKAPPKAKAKAPGRPGPPPPPKAAAAAASSEELKGQANLPPRRQPVGKAQPPPPFGKRLHWKPLPHASLGDTIFEELQPWGEVAPPLDTRQLERLFKPAVAVAIGGATAPPSSVFGSPGTGAGKVSKGGAAQGCLCLVDPKRAQNLAIVLKQVALPTTELCEVLRWMRLSHPVSTEALEHIYENLLPPLLESTEVFQSYDGPPEALRDVERQLLPLVKLPRLKARLQSLLFGKTLKGKHAALLARIRALRDACKQVRDSSSLKQVLGTVLRVGNYLNHGLETPDAGGVEVRGFQMESLLRLRDFRASNAGESSVSALHCIAIHLLPAERQLPAKLREELRAVLEVGGDADSSAAGSAALGIADLREAVGRFRSEAELVQSEAERFGDSYRLEGKASESPSTPGPLETLKRLAEDAGELSNVLEAEMADALSLALRLLEYFGERRHANVGLGAGAGPKAVTAASNKEDEAVERFFVILREFTSQFEACWREVLEKPGKLKLDPAFGLGNAASAAPPAAQDESARSASPPAAASESIGGMRGKGDGGSSKPAVKPPGYGGGLGAILAGEAATAAVRRRSSRLTVPARPAPLAALAAVADSGGGGVWGGRGPRSNISAAAAEVD